MSLALLFLYLMLNMFRMLIHPSSGACDLFVISWVVLLWFDVCWCYVVVCTSVLQPENGDVCWCYVVVFTSVLQPENGYHTTTAKPQRNTNILRTRAIQHMK